MLIRAILACVALTAPAFAAPQCQPGNGFPVADFSAPFTDLGTRGGRSAGAELRRLGVETIIRYYDHTDETLPCKTLVPEETNAILSEGFSIAVVFQHNNDDPMTFLAGRRGLDDAERALDLAAANGQPGGSVIYFGVDGVDEAVRGANWQWNKNAGAPISAAQEAEMKARMGAGNYRKHAEFYEAYRAFGEEFFPGGLGKTEAEAILPYLGVYFDDIRSIFYDYGADYRIGGYGSGMVCDYLLKGGYVELCWLAQSTGWPGYDAFEASGRWALSQQLVTTCPDWKRRSGGVVSLDFNEVGTSPDFGQWSFAEAQDFSFFRPEKKAGVSCYAH
ncbi:MAG: glycoside hydrolase domain-containing protein [Pseudomonadota bacterium]